MMDRVLVGDIGGTSTRFGLAQPHLSASRVTDTRKFSNDSFARFDLALGSYLADCHTKPEHVFLAVAGPVANGYVDMTNRDWTISARALENAFDLKSVTVVNDFSAMARAVPELNDDSFETVLDGQSDASAPILIAGPGTGLGMATLVPGDRYTQDTWRVLGGEGGHARFAPMNDEDMQVARILQAEYRFVSYELITSGMGLKPVHKAICQLNDAAYVPMTAQQVLAGAGNGDMICEKICALRARAVMSFAGDMALANGARGGVALAGGVTARLLPWLRKSEAQRGFLERGPRSAYMEDIPVRVIQGEFIPLIGAAALFADRSKADPAI